MRQRGGLEQRVVPQPLQHGLGDLAGERMVLRQLQVVLGPGRLVAGGDLAVRPVGLLQGGADTGDFLAGEDAGNVQQHGNVRGRLERWPMILILIGAVQENRTQTRGIEM
ncbi:hypothetical protein D3C76_990270 [compost metagenome]